MQKLVQTQKQTLKFSPQQIQMLNLLALNSIELEQKIKDELEENPLLEEGNDPTEEDDTFEQEEPSADFRDYDEYANDDLPDTRRTEFVPADTDFYTAPIVQISTWQDDLKAQIAVLNLTDTQRQIADFIVDSLDDDGFLPYETYTLADDFSFTNNLWIEEQHVTEVLPYIRGLDPAGIAARDLRDCLLLQLERRPQSSLNQTITEVIRRCMPELANHNYEKIQRIFSLDNDQLREVLHGIAHLNPKPVVGGNANSMGAKENILPEYLVTNDDGILEVSLIGRDLPAIRVNRELMQLSEGSTRANKGASTFLRGKLASAEWFVSAIQQRQRSMLAAMKAIVGFQHDYFVSGEAKDLKPMILKDIAERIGLDISTVSRVTSNKFAQTPFGIIHLKDLFTEGLINDDGEEVSNREIQAVLTSLVAEEDKTQPLTDQQLQALLADRGYPVARRTVAKYRESLHIPVAKLRRILA